MVLDDFKQLISQVVAQFRYQTNAQVVGLDLGSDYLKVLKINSNTDPFLIETFAVIALPPGIVIKDEIKDFPGMGMVIKDLLKRANINAINVALAIPRSSTIIKTIYVDKRLNPEEIESRAWVEANRLFPDLVGDIYLDFTVVGIAPTDPDQLELILVACRKDQIKPYLESLREAGLNASTVDVNCYALERVLKHMPCEQTIETRALLNLNTNLSSFVVIKEENMIHAHDQSFDGARLIKKAQEYTKNKGIGVKDEKAILKNDSEYQAILRENLLSHLRHTIHLFFSSRPNISIQQIVLAGDCSMVTNLAEFITQEIGIETMLADPFVHMQMADSVNKVELTRYAPVLTLCCGLALGDKKSSKKP